MVEDYVFFVMEYFVDYGWFSFLIQWLVQIELIIVVQCIFGDWLEVLWWVWVCVWFVIQGQVMKQGWCVYDEILDGVQCVLLQGFFSSFG